MTVIAFWISMSPTESATSGLVSLLSNLCALIAFKCSVAKAPVMTGPIVGLPPSTVCLM